MRHFSHTDVLDMMERVGVLSTSDLFTPPRLRFTLFGDYVGPCVYAWVEERGIDRAIIYIGKAGSSLKVRCAQHQKGFMDRAGRGKDHSDYPTEKLGSGCRIGVYAIWPEPVPFAGELIPAHSSVEDWLIRVTTPTPERNREAKGT